MIRATLQKIFLLVLPLFMATELCGQKQVSQDISFRIISDSGSSAQTGPVWNFEFSPEDKGSVLVASSPKTFSVFVQEKLIATSISGFRWNADSLNQVLGYPKQLTFFTSGKSLIKLTQVRIIPTDPFEPERRKKTVGMNFGIIGGFLLVSVLIFLLSTLSAGASGFFLLWKAFSISIREDRPDEIRANSASALLIYVFTLLFASVTITFLIGDELKTSGEFFIKAFQNLWILLAIMALRYLMIAFVSWLYRMRDISDHQIIGFFQVALLICFFASGVFLINFFFGLKVSSSRLVFTFAFPVLLAGFYFALFLRLMRLTSSKALHLFSYLCLSEFIPLVLLVFTF